MRNCLEHFFHFRSRILYFASRGLLPLGGNTMFVTASVVRENGGWDGECLAEDCELGIRLTALGVKSTVAYDPGLVTREETPQSVKAFIKQRTRWDQGFIRVQAGRLAPAQNQQAASARPLRAGHTFPAGRIGRSGQISLLTLWFIALPIVVSLATIIVLGCNLLVIAAEVAGLKEFGEAFGFSPRIRDYARLALTNPLYQRVLGVAAVQSIARERRGIRNWVKTEHIGAHLMSPDSKAKATWPNGQSSPIGGSRARPQSLPGTVQSLSVRTCGVASIGWE